MSQISFTLEDGTALNCQHLPGTNFVEFKLSTESGKQTFKMHKIQLQALFKAVSGPLKLGIENKRQAG